jgi:2-keto-3-deoxy-L-rhamnonate aldolase RhmA
MRRNEALAKLQRDEVVTCFWMALGSPLLAETVARSQLFDTAMLDHQHGYWNEQTLLHALQVVGPTSTIPLVRVTENDFGQIGRALDMGALGVLVPMVNSAEEARAAVTAMRYPPVGTRSVGGSRLAFYGEDYVPAANSEIICMVMIETAEAVGRAEEILAVPGVDLGFIGPGDLALSLGCHPRRGPAHDEACLKVVRAGRNAGKPVGILALSPEEFGRRVEEGFRFVPHTTDSRAIEKEFRATRAALDKYLKR